MAPNDSSTSTVSGAQEAAEQHGPCSMSSATVLVASAAQPSHPQPCPTAMASAAVAYRARTCSRNWASALLMPQPSIDRGLCISTMHHVSTLVNASGRLEVMVATAGNNLALIAGQCCPPLTSTPLSTAEAAQLAQVLKAVAEPTRL